MNLSSSSKSSAPAQVNTRSSRQDLVDGPVQGPDSRLAESSDNRTGDGISREQEETVPHDQAGVELEQNQSAPEATGVDNEQLESTSLELPPIDPTLLEKQARQHREILENCCNKRLRRDGLLKLAPEELSTYGA